MWIKEGEVRKLVIDGKVKATITPKIEKDVKQKERESRNILCNLEWYSKFHNRNKEITTQYLNKSYKGGNIIYVSCGNLYNPNKEHEIHIVYEVNNEQYKEII